MTWQKVEHREDLHHDMFKHKYLDEITAAGDWKV